MADSKPPAEFQMPTGFYHDEEYGQDSSTLMVKSPRQLYADYLAHSNQTSTRKELPKFSTHEALYTSTATLLKKTRSEVAEYAKDAEWRRREQEYVTNREIMFEKMNEHMRKERESLQRELQQLPK